MRTFAAVALGLALLTVAACSKPTPKTATYPDWNFAVTFLGAPKETPTKANGGQPASFLAESSAGGHDFAVNVIDASGTTVPPDQILASAPATVASSMGVDVGTTTYVASGDVTGREVLFQKDDKPAMIVRFFIAGGKLYEVSGNVPAGAADPQTKAFLDSFHLITPPPPAPANTAPTPDNAAAAAIAATNSPN